MGRALVAALALSVVTAGIPLAVVPATMTHCVCKGGSCEPPPMRLCCLAGAPNAHTPAVAATHVVSPRPEPRIERVVQVAVLPDAGGRPEAPDPDARPPDDLLARFSILLI